MSDVQALEAMNNDTFMNAGGYGSALDRRKSPRIPLTKPVRVGPPGGLPQSPVSAADLSVGGVFIDADRPVRVGARFSVQIPLADGASVYVEEAEVVYNRETTRAPGFGARFVRMNAASRAAIRQEIARLSPLGTYDAGSDISEDRPTVVPAAFGGDVSSHPAPSRARDQDTLDLSSERPGLGSDLPSERPSSLHASSWRDNAEIWFWRNARRLGLFLGSLAAVTVLTATVVFLWSNPQSVRGPAEIPPAVKVPSDIDRSLRSARTPATKVVPAPPVEPPQKKLDLPPPVDVDALDDGAPRVGDVVAEGIEGSDGPDTFVISMSASTRIRGKFVYRRPERVVVDLVGPKIRLDLPEPAGGIRKFRVGYHATFTRVVLDATDRIASAEAEVVGRRLRIQVNYK